MVRRAFKIKSIKKGGNATMAEEVFGTCPECGQKVKLKSVANDKSGVPVFEFVDDHEFKGEFCSGSGNCCLEKLPQCPAH